jgi:predicted secreted Zn-dependent protease
MASHVIISWLLVPPDSHSCIDQIPEKLAIAAQLPKSSQSVVRDVEIIWIYFIGAIKRDECILVLASC